MSKGVLLKQFFVPSVKLSILCTLGLLGSCANPKTEMINHRLSGHLTLISKDQEIAKRLRESIFKEHLGESFFQILQTLKSNLDTYELAVQLDKNPEVMPWFPAKEIPFLYKSPFDQQKLEYLFRAASKAGKGKESPLIICIGEKIDFHQMPKNLEANILYIPSRASMNYHFLAEADFWGVLKDLYKLYPSLQVQKHFLLADASASDAALLLTNNYKAKFDGLGFSSSTLGLKLSNLDHCLIVHYEDKKAKKLSSPWGGKKLIQRLRLRGNQHAKAINGNFQSAIKELLKAKNEPFSLKDFSFEDEQFAKLKTSFQVLAKKVQGDPASISAKIQKKDLFIDAKNVRAIRLEKTRPFHEIEKIFFNGKETEWKDQELLLSDGFFPENVKIKRPSKLVHYFYNEALFIVYQDQDVDKEFVQAAKEMAEKFSRLDFFGLPAMSAKIPVLSLSEYQRIHAPEHRIIAIGNPKMLAFVLSKDPAYLPYLEKNKHIAFALSYPPQDDTKCKLVFSLISDNLEGLQTLARHYHYATSLYENVDLKLWANEGNGYFLLQEELFNSIWKRQEPSQTLLYLPFQTKRLWKAFIKDLLIEESGQNRWLLEPFFQQYLRPPERLSFQSLYEMLPEKHFATVRFKGMAASKIANKILKALCPLEKNGLERELVKTKTFDGEKWIFKEIKKPLEILVEAQALEVLEPEELQLIDYEILPFSMREIFLQKIQNDREGFARKLLRLAKLLELD